MFKSTGRVVHDALTYLANQYFKAQAWFYERVNMATDLIVPIVYGSTAANGDLTLEGTTSATKATSYVNLQTTGGNVGIGTTTPDARLHVVGAVHVTTDLELDGALNHDGAAVGFYGTAPIAQAVLATGAGATVDNVITALQNLGLVKQA